MDFKHKNHLLSGYLLLQKHIQEIQDIIREGCPPTSNVPSLTPLPEDVQNDLMGHLNRIRTLFEELAQKYIADELEKTRKREPVSVTKMWAYIQLKELEENLSTIHPNVFEKKYGVLEQEERILLKETIDQMIQELKEAQKLV